MFKNRVRAFYQLGAQYRVPRSLVSAALSSPCIRWKVKRFDDCLLDGYFNDRDGPTVIILVLQRVCVKVTPAVVAF